MKNSKTILLCICLWFASQIAFSQTLLVANNNPGALTGTNVHIGATALQDAFTASTAGDIIYLVPSSVTYGNLSITHEITLFGVGIRPDKDLGARSLMGQLDVDANNVRLSGLVSQSGGSSVEVRVGWNSPGGNIDGLTIENCRFRRVLMEGTPDATASNVLIRNNVITGTGSLASHVLLNTTSNVVITNNIFIEGGSAAGMIRATNATITYNVFSDTQNEIPFDAVVNCIIDHNVFYGVRVDIPISSTGNSWTNNLSFGNTIDSYHVFNVTSNGNNDTGAPGSNIESVAGSNDPFFVNFPLNATWDDSYNLALQAGSPALNVNGEDVGPSGGATPFDFEGNLLPLIQSVTVPAVIPVGTDLPVTIKAKGN